MSATPLRFGLRFVLIFALLTAGFEATRGTSFERFVIETLILKPTVWALNSVTPSEHVELAGRTLHSLGGPKLHVTRGCEGVEMFLLLLAAILAFPASLGRRLHGLLVGAALAYVLSIARLALLYCVLRFSPNSWETLHGFILPLAPTALLALYFLRWTSLSTGAATAPTFDDLDRPCLRSCSSPHPDR